jgi:hypothetical protein
VRILLNNSLIQIYPPSATRKVTRKPESSLIKLRIVTAVAAPNGPDIASNSFAPPVISFFNICLNICLFIEEIDN